MMKSKSSVNCIHRHNIKILNLLNLELQLLNSKPMTKNELKELLSELKKVKDLRILVLEYKKRNDRKICHSRIKLITSDSYIDEAFKSMHQSITSNIQNYACEDWTVNYKA